MTITDLFGRKLPVVGLDFESYYHIKDFTLSKMTMTEYIRSPKFKAHGASIRLPDDEKAWYVDGCELRDVLREVDWKNTALLCHNTAFDGLILSHHFRHVPGYYLDTMSMSRGEYGIRVPHSLDQLSQRLGNGEKIKDALESTAGIYNLPWRLLKKLIPYANMDVDLMWKNFHDLYYDMNFPEKELHIIDLTLRAFCDPRLQVNKDLCLEEALEEASNKTKLCEVAGVSASAVMSNDKFADLLRERGVEPPMKIRKLTPTEEKKQTQEERIANPEQIKEVYAFAKGDLEFQALAAKPAVADIVRARMAVKSTISQSRAYRLMKMADPALPVLLHYCGAHTHRWSGGEKINLQNLPSGRKPGQTNRLRRAIEAPDGYVIVVVDSSQIEARVLAWAAQDTELLEYFAKDSDVYSIMAEDIYGYPVNKYTQPDERFVGKTAVLGLGYGMGWKKFAYTIRAGVMGPPMDISDELAIKTVNVYRRKRRPIVNLWGDLDANLSKMLHGKSFEYGPWEFTSNKVWMPNDLAIHYHQLTADETDDGFRNFRYTSRTGPTSIYGGKFAENLVQSTARTVVAHQALEIAKRYHIANLVHDEVIFLAPEDEADEAYKFGVQCLSTPPKWCEDLPVAAEGGYDKVYSK